MQIVNSQDIDYQSIVACLQVGGIVVYPTDTAYALGAAATNPAAIKKIYQIKGRSETKALPLIAADLAMAQTWALFSAKALALASQHWPGPLTLVLPVKSDGLAPEVIQDGFIAVRVPDNLAARTLSAHLDAPLISTSANRAGEGPFYTVAAVKDSLGEAYETVDYAIDSGQLVAAGVSTMVKVWDNNIELLRSGVIKIM